MRRHQERDYANRCLPIFLRMLGLQDSPQAEARRLLCVLFVWLSTVPTYSGRGFGGLLRQLKLGQRRNVFSVDALGFECTGAHPAGQRPGVAATVLGH